MESLTNPTSTFNSIETIVFWYPYLMSLLWIAGSLIFAHYHEKGKRNVLNKDEYNWPPISILIPCYNEDATIEESIRYLSTLTYPKYEIIAVNDGSSDRTGEMLKKLAKHYSCLRVIDCHENKGKANALHMAAHAAKYEYLICIDSDAILDKDAPYHLVKHFITNGERVGAVTGNPRIRNRDTLLGKLQLVEYASIIGAIKRAQRVFGKVMTVSGVIVAFRKKALVSVGLWDRDMITEDIAISWKLQKNFWDIRYEPQALCWMLVPEKLGELWKQRVRWAQGGQEIIFRHYDIFKDWRKRRLWPIYIEQILSLLWAFLWLGLTLMFIFVGETKTIFNLWFTFSSFALIMLSYIQLYIAMKNESVYDGILKHYLWATWYPAVYWIFNTFVALAALPKSIKSTIKGGYAVWSSPDRGNVNNDSNDSVSDKFDDDFDYMDSSQDNSYSNSKPYVEPTLILKSNQSIFRKIFDIFFSLFMWSYTGIVVILFVSAIVDYNNDFLGLLKTNFKITNSDIRSFILTSIVYFVILLLVLFVWKAYNLFRYDGLNRRKYPGDTTREDMLGLNLVNSTNYDILQRNKVVTFENNPIRDL